MSPNEFVKMGDATNLVIIFAGELLKMAETLIRMGGLQPSDIIQGYEKALDFAMETMKCWCTYFLDSSLTDLKK